MTAASAPNGDGRQAELAGGLSAAQGGRADRWLRRMLVAGALLLPLGLVVILLGWLGAANSPRLVEQVPYLISGGLFGLGLVITGGFVYFGYWVARLARDNREQTRRLESVLARIQQRLDEAGPTPLGAPPAGAVPLITPRGSQYHRPDCPVVAGRDDVRPLPRRDGTLTPCKICRPQ